MSVEAGCIAIAARIDHASAVDVDTLKQKAFAEARRHGAREVRLVINGIEQTPIYFPGTPYGH
ncbi:hypothetical protein [Paraburkholderia sp. GAS82]|uniref:hypothetical protein n=1 Tax=Paraburkholderia sp. GAS82 TaxID=3035137 RepID=UPI003D21CA12